MREGSSRVFQKGPEDILIRREEKRDKNRENGVERKTKASETVWKSPEFYDKAGMAVSQGLEKERLVSGVEGRGVISMEDYKARHSEDGRQGTTRTVKGDPKRFRRLNKVRVGMGK